MKWWDHVLAAKTHDRDLPEEDRLKHADADSNAALDANYFWLVVPEERGVGAWIEFGLALAQALRHGANYIIVSGDWKKSIFTSLADHRFDSHEEALAFLQTELARAA